MEMTLFRSKHVFFINFLKIENWRNMYEVSQILNTICWRYRQNAGMNVDLDGYRWSNNDGVNSCWRILGLKIIDIWLDFKNVGN